MPQDVYYSTIAKICQFRNPADSAVGEVRALSLDLTFTPITSNGLVLNLIEYLHEKVPKLSAGI